VTEAKTLFDYGLGIPTPFSRKLNVAYLIPSNPRKDKRYNGRTPGFCKEWVSYGFDADDIGKLLGITKPRRVFEWLGMAFMQDGKNIRKGFWRNMFQ